MRIALKIAAVALPFVLAAAAPLAAASAQSGLFGPGSNAASTSHDFSAPKASAPVETKAPAKAAATRPPARAPKASASRATEQPVEQPVAAPVEDPAPVDEYVPEAEPLDAAPAPPMQEDDAIAFMREDGAESASEGPSAGGLLVRTIGALMLIVGLLVGAGYALKRLGGPKFGTPRSDAPELAVLASVALGDKKSLTVVRFGERTLLVGSTTNGITLLADEHEYDRPPVRSVGYLLESADSPTFEDELALASRHDR